MADSTDNTLWSSYDSVSASELVNTISSPARTPSSSLDKDAFLQLLITQMKYQDPLSPMENSEFLAQMAQFSSLEQMQNMNATFAKSQAYAMIGKTVYAYYPNADGEYKEITGLVSAVTIKNGEAYLYVEGNDVPASSVSVVGDDYFTAQQLDSIYTSVSNTRDTGLIGKYIQALIMDKDGNVSDYVEGIVDYVKFNGSSSVLVVGNKEVFPGEVASVSGDPLLIGKSIMVPYSGEDEDGEPVSGYKEAEILGVTIDKGKAFLQVEGGESIAIEKINYIMESLDYVGKAIDFNSYKGKVDSITIKNGIPYFNIGDKQLSYTEFKDL